MGEGEVINEAVELVAYNPQEPWEACRMGRREMPCAKAGEVVVKVLCRSLNPSDVSCLSGLYRVWQPASLPAVPGFEGMGVVYQLGEGVSQYKVGDRVFPISRRSELTGQGLWQQYIVVPVDALVPMPPSLPDEVAAQFLVNPWTVVGMLDVLKVPKGEYVLQTAAASVLGRMVIQYAHYQGIKTINVVRRAEQVEELKALGADEVLVSTQEDVVEKVKSITGGKMAHSAIECVGGGLTSVVVNCVRDGSTVLIFGALGPQHAEIPILDLVFRDIKVHGFYLGAWLQGLSPEELMNTGGLVITLLEKQVITPIVGEKYPLHQFKDAIKKSLEPGRGGKVLLIG